MDILTLLLVIATIIFMFVDVYYERRSVKLIEEQMKREEEDKAPWDQN